MGQNLSDAVMLVMTPDAWCYGKHALSHVAKFADDTTGPVVEDDGTVRQGRIGFISRIPEEQFDTPGGPATATRCVNASTTSVKAAGSGASGMTARTSST